MCTNHVHWTWNVLIERETYSFSGKGAHWIGLSPIKFDYISDFVLIWLHPPLPHPRPHSRPHSHIGGTHFSYNHTSDVDRATVWSRLTLRATWCGWHTICATWNGPFAILQLKSWFLTMNITPICDCTSALSSSFTVVYFPVNIL